MSRYLTLSQFSRQAFPGTWSSQSGLGWLGCELQGSRCLCPAHAGMTSTPRELTFAPGLWTLNSGPLARRAGTLWSPHCPSLGSLPNPVDCSPSSKHLSCVPAGEKAVLSSLAKLPQVPDFKTTRNIYFCSVWTLPYLPLWEGPYEHMEGKACRVRVSISSGALGQVLNSLGLGFLTCEREVVNCSLCQEAWTVTRTRTVAGTQKVNAGQSCLWWNLL